MNPKILEHNKAIPYVNKCWAILSKYYFNATYLDLLNRQRDFVLIYWGPIIRYEIYEIKSYLTYKNTEKFKAYFEAKYKLKMKLTPLPENLK